MCELGSTAVLVWGMIFGSIGVGFFIYGKKLPAIAPLYVGVALYDFPYFIANVYALVGVGRLFWLSATRCN